MPKPGRYERPGCALLDGLSVSFALILHVGFFEIVIERYVLEGLLGLAVTYSPTS